MTECLVIVNARMILFYRTMGETLDLKIAAHHNTNLCRATAAVCDQLAGFLPSTGATVLLALGTTPSVVW